VPAEEIIAEAVSAWMRFECNTSVSTSISFVTTLRVTMRQLEPPVPLVDRLPLIVLSCILNTFSTFVACQIVAMIARARTPAAVAVLLASITLAVITISSGGLSVPKPTKTILAPVLSALPESSAPDTTVPVTRLLSTRNSVGSA
jgi:hypothetical protein